jgi:hypothetical protein
MGSLAGFRVAMLKHLTCQAPNRFIRLAWLSLPPNGDVSFGLNDKTYISPRFKGRNYVWSAFNRVTAEYEVASDPNTLEPVKNPHFTFHQPGYFHLKSDKDRAQEDEALFDLRCCDGPERANGDAVDTRHHGTAQSTQIRRAPLVPYPHQRPPASRPFGGHLRSDRDRLHPTGGGRSGFERVDMGLHSRP